MVPFIQDLGDFITREAIPKPILLFMDGAKCHLSLEIAKLCTQLNIQPILLWPNTTHLTQPLDLTYFQSFKAELQKEKEAWHRQNIGISLNKYTIIPLAYTVTERILKDKISVIPNGFRSGGICPWDPSAPTKTRMDPSQIYKQGSNSVSSCKGSMSTNFSCQAESGQGLIGEEEMTGSVPTLCGQVGSSPTPSNKTCPSPVISSQEGTSPVPGSQVSSSSNVDKQDPSFILPEFNQHFLSRFELLLSGPELDTFHNLYSSRNFTEPNLPYQSWLMLKCGLEPVVEREAVEQVLGSLTPKKIVKSLKRGGLKQPDGPARYIINSPEFEEILEEHEAKDKAKKAKKTIEPKQTAMLKKAPVKKAPVKKVPAKKAPANKAPSKKALAKKAPAKKAPAQK